MPLMSRDAQPGDGKLPYCNTHDAARVRMGQRRAIPTIHLPPSVDGACRGMPVRGFVPTDARKP
jgi:hypothetical protein